MNIGHIASYIEVVKLGSISAAAEKCNLTQSALSQQIRVLEKNFNTKLLDRSHKGIVPTHTGEIAYNHFISMMESYVNIFQDIDKLTSNCETIKIISTAFACAYALPCTFYYLKNKYPDYSLEVETAQSAIIEEKILKGQGDMGIIVGKTSDKRLACQKVFSDEFLLVCSPLFDIPESITKQDIYNYQFVMLAKHYRTQQILIDQLADNDIQAEKLNVLYSVDTAEAMKLSVINGFGVALLPYMAIKKELYYKQLRLVKCDDLKLESNYYSIKQQNTNNVCIGKDKVIKYIEKILNQTIC